jgi:hypothetical protein
MSFKFNWGHGMFLAMAFFVIFIGSFVYKVMFQDEYDHKLVSEEYYKEELHYQEEIDRLNNAGNLEENVQVKQSKEGLTIIFPSNFDYKNIKTTIKLQRLSDGDLDIIKELKLDSLSYLIPNKDLVKGHYVLKLNWEYNGETYQFREKINYQ